MQQHTDRTRPWLVCFIHFHFGVCYKIKMKFCLDCNNTIRKYDSDRVINILLLANFLQAVFLFIYLFLLNALYYIDPIPSF